MAERVLVAIPQETVNDESVRILSWKVASGARVEKDQFICEVETSKAVMEIHAPAAGVVEYHCAAGDEVPVGATICEIFPGGRVLEPAKEEHPAQNGASPAAVENLPPARLTPLALRIAAECGVDVNSFPQGTLVRQNDVLRKAGKLAPEAWAKPQRQTLDKNRDPQKAEPERENPLVTGVPVEWTNLSRRKLLEGKILGGGQVGSIQSSVTCLCRAPKLRARVEKLGLSAVGLNSLIIFETARLLRKYPEFNAVHDGGRMAQYREVNVGWAIDGGQGLVVPVIHQADEKDIRDIAAVMQRQLEAYIENKLAPTDFSRGTFSISDLSGEGINVFQPLIGKGQSAILGIGSDRESPAGELFYLTLAFDHQLTEGRKAAQFVRDLAVRLEAHSAVEQAADEASKMFCALCQRDKKTLQGLKAVLLKSEVPLGFVCSFCVSGW